MLWNTGGDERKSLKIKKSGSLDMMHRKLDALNIIQNKTITHKADNHEMAGMPGSSYYSIPSFNDLPPGGRTRAQDQHILEITRQHIKRITIFLLGKNE